MSMQTCKIEIFIFRVTINTNISFSKHYGDWVIVSRNYFFIYLISFELLRKCGIRE